MKPNPNSNITVIHDSQEWSTDLTGDISEVKINGKTVSPKKTFISGMCWGLCMGLTTTMLLAWLYFTTSNLTVVNEDRVIILQNDPKDDKRHVWIKTGRHQVTRMLKAQGIKWDEDLKRWVESKAPSVTILSPKS